MDKCYVVWSDYLGEIISICSSLEEAYKIARIAVIDGEAICEDLKDAKGWYHFDIVYVEDENCWILSDNNNIYEDYWANVEIREEKFNQPLTRTY